MALDKDLVFQIKVDSSGAIKSIKAMDKAIGDTSKEAKDAAKNFDKVDKSVNKVAKQTNFFSKSLKSLQMSVISVNQAFELTQRVISGFGQVFGEASRQAREFGASIAEIYTLLSDAEIANAKVVEQVEALSIAFGKDTRETAKAFYQAVSSTATEAAEATNLLGAAGKLAVGGITELNRATDALTTIINAYKLRTDESLEVTDALFIAMKEGKALDLDTEIPTPDRGFIKIKDIKDGDKIINEKGEVETVVHAHNIIEDAESYELIFEDGTTMKACKDHNWLTYTDQDRMDINRITRNEKYICLSNRKKRGCRPVAPTVKTTKEILDDFEPIAPKRFKYRHYIPLTKAMKFDRKKLPIDPYLLGVWLGDGSASTSRISTIDNEILDAFKDKGYGVNKIAGDNCDYGIVTGENNISFHKQLRLNNLLNNKHIPEIFLIGSINQRLEILKGLMDTDGSIGEDGVCEFVSVTKNLANGVKYLVDSLGMRANITTKEPRSEKHKLAYRVRFSPTKYNPFKLERKILRVKKEYKKKDFIAIVEIRKIENRPMRCLTVTGDNALFIAGRNCIVTHNTTIGELSEFMSNVVPIANSLGLSFQELLALISAITIDGTLTGQAVTQLRSALVGLSKQTPQLSKVLKDLNVETIKGAIETEGFFKVLNKIIGATDGTTESLTELFGRVEAVTGILTITGAASDKFVNTMDMMKKASEDVGKTTEKAFKLIAETDKFKSEVAVQRLYKSLRSMGSIINKVLIPAMQGLATVLEAVVATFKGLGTFVNNIGLLESAILGLSSAIVILSSSIYKAKLVATFTTLQSSMTILATKITTITPALLAVAGVFSKFIGVAAGIATIVAGVDLLVRNIERLPTVLKVVTKTFQLSFANIGFLFKSLNVEIAEGAANLLSSFGLDSLAEQARNTAARVAGSFNKAGDEITKLRSELGELTKSLDAGISGKIFDRLNKYFNGLDMANKEQKKVGASAKTMGEEIKKALSPDQVNALLELQKATAMYQNEIAKFGKDEFQLISLQVQFEKEKLDILTKQLKQKGAYSDEADVEIKKQKELLEIIGQQRKAEAMKARGGDIASIAGDIGQIGSTMSALGEQAGSSFISKIGGGLSEAASAAGSSMAGPIMAIILSIPEIFKKIGDFVDKVTNIGPAIASAFQSLLDSMGNMIMNFTANTINAVGSIIESIANYVFDFPKLIDGFLMNITNALENFFTRLPEFIGKFVQGLSQFLPSIVAKFITFLIKGMPRIVAEFFKMIPELVKAIVNGIIQGLMDGFTELWDAILGKLDLGQSLQDMGDSIAKLGADLSKSAQQIFAVEEFATAESISAMIRDSAKEAVDWLGLWWGKFVKWLQELWDRTFGQWGRDLNKWFNEIWGKLEDIWKKTFGLLSMDGFWTTLQDVWDKTFGLLSIEKLKQLGQAIWDGLVAAIDGGLETIKSIGTAIYNGLYDGLVSLATWFYDRGKEIYNGFGEALTALSTWFRDRGREIYEGFGYGLIALSNWFRDRGREIYDGFNSALGKIGNWFKDRGEELVKPIRDFLKNFDFSSWGGGGGGGGIIGGITSGVTSVAKSIGKSFGFAEGGPIPYNNITPIPAGWDVKGYANGGGVDNQIIAAQSGEYMLSRLGRAVLGDTTLNAANKGRNISGQTVINNYYSSNIDAKIDIKGGRDSANDIASKTLDKLKRQSLRGQFTLDSKGLRTV